MIKNFVVKVKQIHSEDKGLKNFLSYLEDEKRHPGGIIKIKQFDKNHFFKQTILNIAEHNLNKKAGRKTKNFADSYIFTLPPEVNEKLQNKEILMKITADLINDIYEEIKKEIQGINKNELIKQIFLNIHKDKKHIHFNVVFPRVLKINNELISNRITNRKKFLNNIKKKWNLNLLKNLNLSIEDYKPITKFKKGYKNQYFKEYIEEINKLKKENENLLKELEKKKAEILKLDELIKMKRSEIKREVEKLLEENERRQEIANNFQLLIRYYKNLTKKYYKEKNYEKAIEEYWKFKRKLEEFKKQNKIKVLQPIIDNMEEETQTIYETLQL